jgi:hypothetical protein
VNHCSAVIADKPKVLSGLDQKVETIAEWLIEIGVPN